MKRFALSLALCVGAFAAAAQQPIVIKFSHVVATDTPKGKGAERFKQLAEERSGGRVKVEVYPNSQLFKDGEEMEALQLGSVQMLAPSVSKFGPLGIREYEAFDIPYIFPDKAVLARVTEGPVGAGLFRKLEAKGIVGLAYWDNGFKVMTSNKPMRTPGEAKGQKLRIQSSKVLDSQMRALGALPQVMAFSEVYQGLQTGVVDGTENTPSNVYSQKTHEVQKYLVVTNHGYIGYAVIASKKFWDALPPDLRAILEGAMRDATVYANSIAQRENDEALEKMRASGRIEIVTLTDAEKEAWRKALAPVQKEVAPRVGQDLIDAIQKEAAAQGYK